MPSNTGERGGRSPKSSKVKGYSHEERLEWAVIACLATFATVTEQRWAQPHGLRLNLTALATIARYLETPDAIEPWLEDWAWPFEDPKRQAMSLIFPAFIAALQLGEDPASPTAEASLAALVKAYPNELRVLSHLAERHILVRVLERRTTPLPWLKADR